MKHFFHARCFSSTDFLRVCIFTHKSLRRSVCFSRLEPVSASLIMTKVLLRTRMMLAEICTGKTLPSSSNNSILVTWVFNSAVCYCSINRISFFKSALTQFFQIFPEYQSNEFYATGEVCFFFFFFNHFSSFANEYKY